MITIISIYITKGSSKVITENSSIKDLVIIKAETHEFHDSILNVPKETEVTANCSELLQVVDKFGDSMIGMFCM